MHLKHLIVGSLLVLIAAAAPTTQTDLSTPKAAAQAYYDALYGGDWTALNAVTLNNATSGAFLQAIQHAIPVVRHFSATVSDKFGADAAKEFTNGDPQAELAQTLPNAEVTINGNHAIVEVPYLTHAPDKLNFTKVEKQWKYDARQSSNPNRAIMTRETMAATDKIAKLTARVQAGEFKTIDDLKSAYHKAMTERTPSTAPSSTGQSNQGSK
jgi:hypothetical protein